MKSISFFTIALVGSACSGTTERHLAPPSGGKGDSSPYTVLGTLSYGQSSTAASFDDTNGYGAYTFTGNAGDAVTVSISDDAGSPISYLLDGNGNIVATGAASLQATLAAADTYAILFADELATLASFAVALDGSAATCTTDADCTFLSTGDATMVPECGPSHTCVIVPVGQVRCGGFVAHPHSCPDGYRCHFNNVPDIPGTCVVDDCGAGCDSSQMCCFTWGVGGPSTGSYECSTPVNNACPLNL